MLSEAERSGQSSGVPVYDFLYELDSTRGRKRILSSVRITCGSQVSWQWNGLGA
jgi:hypothetical protein